MALAELTLPGLPEDIFVDILERSVYLVDHEVMKMILASAFCIALSRFAPPLVRQMCRHFQGEGDVDSLAKCASHMQL